jgi:hypothetical protein
MRHYTGVAEPTGERPQRARTVKKHFSKNPRMLGCRFIADCCWETILILSTYIAPAFAVISFCWGSNIVVIHSAFAMVMVRVSFKQRWPFHLLREYESSYFALRSCLAGS